MPLSLQLGAGWFVEKPNAGPAWKLPAAVTASEAVARARRIQGGRRVS